MNIARPPARTGCHQLPLGLPRQCQMPPRRMSLNSFAAARRGRNVQSAKAQRASALATRRLVVPGKTRTGGFYGRYNKPRSAGGDNELKFLDTALNFSIDATGEVPATGQLNLIPQDDTQSGRIGKKVVVKKVQVQAQLSFVPASAANAVVLGHIYVVLDTQCNGAAAAVTDVLTSATMNGAMRNLDNTERFRVLKHHVFSFNAMAGATTAYNSMIKNLAFNIPCDIPIIFDNSATTGAITTIRSNNIFLLAGCNATGDDLVSCTGTARIRYAD